jgi:hypothetical protein
MFSEDRFKIIINAFLLKWLELRWLKKGVSCRIPKKTQQGFAD